MWSRIVTFFILTWIECCDLRQLNWNQMRETSRMGLVLRVHKRSDYRSKNEMQEIILMVYLITRCSHFSATSSSIAWFALNSQPMWLTLRTPVWKTINLSLHTLHPVFRSSSLCWAFSILSPHSSCLSFSRNSWSLQNPSVRGGPWVFFNKQLLTPQTAHNNIGCFQNLCCWVDTTFFFLLYVF